MWGRVMTAFFCTVHCAHLHFSLCILLQCNRQDCSRQSCATVPNSHSMSHRARAPRHTHLQGTGSVLQPLPVAKDGSHDRVFHDHEQWYRVPSHSAAATCCLLSVLSAPSLTSISPNAVRTSSSSFLSYFFWFGSHATRAHHAMLALPCVVCRAGWGEHCQCNLCCETFEATESDAAAAHGHDEGGAEKPKGGGRPKHTPPVHSSDGGGEACPLMVFRLRYFTAREISRLMGFPDEFVFPASTTLKQQRRLLGNSLNVQVVALLMKHLLLQQPSAE